ncbi:hypothetical protein [Burkholderia glumae]|uniref:hypothetical protein n=1 Tax=Burkholderia glumae TaxID=337 RepID=UPI002149B22D|nr:hypothetical protein [Burkholderia glumae]MCR1768926.1 hypothetical protein [Burkholderia glumae]
MKKKAGVETPARENAPLAGAFEAASSLKSTRTGNTSALAALTVTSALKVDVLLLLHVCGVVSSLVYSAVVG